MTLRQNRRKNRSEAIAGARTAFRETVMAVDHYDEMYGETLEEHVAMELSAAAAAVFRSDSATSFTDMHKTALAAVIKDAIDQRDLVREQLETELDSIEPCRTDLVELLGCFDGATGPAWFRSDFESRLNKLARTRQEEIQRRHHRARTDGHDLCHYLYNEPPWTYPVLTAIARLRSSVSI